MSTLPTKSIRRIFIYLLAGLFSLLLIILCYDSLAGRCPQSPAIAGTIENVSSENLKRHVETLSAIGSRFRVIEKNAGLKGIEKFPAELRAANQKLAPFGRAIPTGIEKTRKLTYLKNELSKIGLNPESLDFDFDFGKGTNLYATCQGTANTAELIDVVAHYDTVAGSPGADDNSSGVAGVLEIARLIAAQKTIQRSVRFIFYDYEEFGLLGSTAMVHYMKENPDKLQLATTCLNLEMIGYFNDEPNSQKTPLRVPVIFDPPTIGNCIVTVGNFRSHRYGRRLDGTFKTYVPELPLFSATRVGDLLADAARSDHLPYWKNKIPAVMIGDTANFRNPHYHKPTDLPETLDFSRMRLVVKGAAAYVLDWCHPE